MQFDDDREKFAAAITYGDHTRDLQDIINLAQNLDCYWLYPSVKTEEDYGHYLIEELDESELPKKQKIISCMRNTGGGCCDQRRYIYLVGPYLYCNTFTQWYDGRGRAGGIPGNAAAASTGKGTGRP